LAEKLCQAAPIFFGHCSLLNTYFKLTQHGIAAD
jgi:hypothetical protein